MSKVNVELLNEKILKLGMDGVTTLAFRDILSAVHEDLTGAAIEWEQFFKQGAVYRSAGKTYVWTLFDNMAFMQNIVEGSIYSDLKLSVEDYKKNGFERVGDSLPAYLAAGGKL